ncbi:hypothetical protein KY289_008986 [Solanum tuberosum]|nr:hypothetical protein KY289_008986 [Solanum tuberosum]
MAFKFIAILLLEIITFATLVWGENGLAIKSIQSEDGDVIDCIDIFKQPALYHPALKNHKIQMIPSYNTMMETIKTNDQEKSYKCVTTQIWHKSGSCPKGTIPIRRTQNIKKDQIMKPNFFHLDKGLKIKKDINLTQKNHSMAILLTEGYRYVRGKTDMITRNPHVEDDEYSTSRLTLKSGSYYNYQDIESGWTVNPRVYGDRQTRLFTYWTNDGSKETGCFDLTCPGFVQISHEIALGAAIYPISTQYGLPYSITIYIYKDLNTSNWWLQYGGSINIGYWPSKIFEGGLEVHAETVQWGGEVYSKNSEDGDVIDCVDIFKQPALYHPALKNHKIQMTPSYNTMMEPTKTNDQEKSYKYVTTQTWHKSGSCPKGTIPIRRTQNNYKKDHIKKPNFFHLDKRLRIKEEINLAQKNHSLAILHTEGIRYMGGKTDMKTWNPHVEEDDEYSTSRLALMSGAYNDYQDIESGWAVYGDRQTRFFTYWTNDGSRETGCFDLTCPGFVQTSHEIALGAAIYPISTQNGLPYSISVFIFKDLNTSNWWLQYGGSINIGYWPSKIFEGGLGIHAQTVQWGGEVYSKNVGKHPHTKTQMGSGAFPVYISANTGFMKNMRILDNSMELRFPHYVDAYSQEYD